MTETAPVPSIVRRIWPETPRLKGLVVEVPQEVADQHVRPGQYVVAKANGDGRVFLVIASRPGEARAFELLLGESAEKTLAPIEGGAIEIHPPAGPGFRMETARGKDVLLFAAGGALAALKPVIDTIRMERAAFGRVTLYLGAHTEADFPYAGYYAMWKRDRIDLVRAVSRPWVQEMFEKDPPSVSDAAAFVCGGKQMMADVTETLVRAGLPPERIGRNF
jgi:NAD(P)H-flavin reductase